MRAYLSDFQARQSEIRYSRVCPVGTTAARILLLAESEARRILADAEPERAFGIADQYATYHRAGFPTFPRMNAPMRRGADDSLADSLSAFLAAPDPAAYLRSKQ